ncbi:MAG: DUF2800 domain-containing protein [Bacteroidales bacterium]|nr:DUF2800 domain-containing protein [Bacteroidales bacterium]
MQFKEHKRLEGLHAPFGASQSSWLRYSDEKIIDSYRSKKAQEMGTIYHLWAKQTIDLGIKQPRSEKTLYKYVNDAIGFKMNTEVILFYSPRSFGTADAISFKNNKLRIHDLKTGKVGKIESHVEQLLIYTALFCLEYSKKPGDIEMELRVYKNDDVLIIEPTAEDILPIMDKIVHINKILDKIDEEG